MRDPSTSAIERKPLLSKHKTAPYSGFADLGVNQRYSRCTEVFGQGEPAKNIFKVLSGVVRLSQFTRDGRRQICGFYFPGDLIGLSAAENFRFTAETIVPSELLVMDQRRFMHAVMHQDEMAEAYWRESTLEFGRLQQHLLILGRKSALERLISFLVLMSERFNSDVLLLSMGRQDIADYLGLTIETVSRMLTLLDNAGLIELPRPREIVLRSVDALKYLEEEWDEGDDISYKLARCHNAYSTQYA